jgi:hypothetical protein
MFRTDSHNNPAAFTTDIAKQGGLVLGTDYTQGDPFTAGTMTLYTARLIGDPIELTIRVIDAIGYRTKAGATRWTYICLPKFVWKSLSYDQKRDVIGYHYLNEAGTEMRHLFPNYGQS